MRAAVKRTYSGCKKSDRGVQPYKKRNQDCRSEGHEQELCSDDGLLERSKSAAVFHIM